MVDDLTVVRSVVTEPINHAPAKLFMNTGTTQFGRPSMGSWITYGIGSESNELPGFVVLQSGPRGPRGGAVNWGSGFLPTSYQGVPLRSGGEPILDLASPAGVDASSPPPRLALDAIGDLNRMRLDATGDPEIATRIAAYEMAFRMQSSAPELTDLRGETRATLDLYGASSRVNPRSRRTAPARLQRDDWSSAGSGSSSSITPTGTTTADPARTSRATSTASAATSTARARR